MTSDGVADDAIPARGSTSIAVIETVRQLVMQAGVALRAIPHVMQIFVRPYDPMASIPSATGARWWRHGAIVLKKRLETHPLWPALISKQRDQRLELELIEFVRQQSSIARPGERLLGSTETGA